MFSLKLTKEVFIYARNVIAKWNIAAQKILMKKQDWSQRDGTMKRGENRLRTLKHPHQTLHQP